MDWYQKHPKLNIKTRICNESKDKYCAEIKVIIEENPGDQLHKPDTKLWGKEIHLGKVSYETWSYFENLEDAEKFLEERKKEAIETLKKVRDYNRFKDRWRLRRSFVFENTYFIQEIYWCIEAQAYLANIIVETSAESYLAHAWEGITIFEKTLAPNQSYRIQEFFKSYGKAYTFIRKMTKEAKKALKEAQKLYKRTVEHIDIQDSETYYVS